MKLYHANNGRWYGTQADAKAAVGKGNFGERDVPTDKWGLIGWLNNEGIGAIAPDVDPDFEPTPAPAVKRDAAATMTYADRSIAIDDVIASASFGEAVRIATDANTRVAEHLKEFADAKFPKPATGYHKAPKIEDLLS